MTIKKWLATIGKKGGLNQPKEAKIAGARERWRRWRLAKGQAVRKTTDAK